MNIKTLCRLTLLVFVAIGLFRTLKTDIEGRPAVAPGGFGDVVGTIIAYGIVTLLYWGAGLFSFNE